MASFDQFYCINSRHEIEEAELNAFDEAPNATLESECFL